MYKFLHKPMQQFVRHNYSVRRRLSSDGSVHLIHELFVSARHSICFVLHFVCRLTVGGLYSLSMFSRLGLVKCFRAFKTLDCPSPPTYSLTWRRKTEVSPESFLFGHRPPSPFIFPGSHARRLAASLQP